jgi:hypothetical protein
LIQIRTHAQKYFLRHAPPPAQKGSAPGQMRSAGDEDTFDLGGEMSGAYPTEYVAAASLRHVALEPLSPADPVGLDFRMEAGSVIVNGFSIIPISQSSGGAPQAAQLSAAEESDIVRIGDVVLGVSGVCVLGLEIAEVKRAIAAASSITQGGVIILHLSDRIVDASLIEEIATQAAGAALQLLGSKQAVETVQQAISHALSFPDIPIPLRS